MTRGERQGLAALATVLALLLGGIWLSHRSTNAWEPEEIMLPDSTQNIADTPADADSATHARRAPKTSRLRQSAEAADRTSPLDVPTPDGR